MRYLLKTLLNHKIYIFLVLISFLVPKSLFAQSIFNYTLNDVEGSEIQLGDIWGEKLTVFDFWASWCKPCMKSIPKLIELSEEFEKKGVKFIGVNADSPRNSAKVKPLTYSLGIQYIVLLDADQDLMNNLLVSTLPTLIIFSKQGEVLFTHIGYVNGDELIIKETLNKLLDETE